MIPTYLSNAGPGLGASIVASLLLLLIGCVDPVASQPAVRTVTLHATHRDGVPLHREPGQHFEGRRLPDAVTVEVLEERADGHWLRVRLGSTTGWISARYIRPRGSPRATSSAASVEIPRDSAWHSPAACEAALAQGTSRPSGVARLGSWNVRWFPTGRAGPAGEGGGTDVEWLSCLIVHMGVDALAVQEFVLDPRGRNALEDLLGRLEDRTGAPWQRAFDRCSDDGRQHVGLLWNTARVLVTEPRTLDRINPLGGCRNRLRPGLLAHLRFVGGADLDVVVVHLDSGKASRDFTNRRASSRRLAGLAPSLGEAERDLIVLGDFNTMGCDRCDPRTTGAAELASFEATLAAGQPPLVRLPPTVACSEYYRGHGGLLDHVFVRRGMEELPAGARVRIEGICGALDCADLHGADLEAYRRLSDHCPLVVELDDRDLDPPDHRNRTESAQ